MSALLGDVNADLMNAYQQVARAPKAIIAALALAQRVHGLNPHETYYDTRHAFNGGQVDPLQRAAMFLYLNRTCFNGLWRVNRRGQMNTPIGRYANPTICDPARLLACAAVLQMATLRCGPWQATVADAAKGDLIYFDPPYVPVSATSSFTAYAAGGFTDDHQAELAAAVRDLVRRGVHVRVSNSDCKRVRQLYKGLRIVKVKVARSINADAARRGAVGEVIVVGEP